MLLESTIVERGNFFYLFSEYIMTRFIKNFCCCCIKKDSRWWEIRLFRYNRYVNAVEKMNGEIDIIKHVSNVRISEFMAKRYFQKHQRALVQNFKKYQLPATDSKDLFANKQRQVIDALAGSEGDISVLLDSEAQKKFIREAVDLTDEQYELLIEMDEKFSPTSNDTDRCILYEVTGYKHLEENDNSEFWDQYIDFFALGDNLNIRQDRIDTRALDTKKK